jgi:hypothetical protein
MYTDCIRLDVLALWKEASKHDCTRHSQALVAKVSFSHEGLHGDWHARCMVTTERDLQKRRTVCAIMAKEVISVHAVHENTHLGCRMTPWFRTALFLKQCEISGRYYPNDLNETINDYY